MITTELKYLLNKFYGFGGKTQLGTLIDRNVNCVVADYDFTVSGGAQSAITIGASLIPANAIVYKVLHEELTNVTSLGSATVTLQAGSTDLTGAIAKATFTGIVDEALAGAVAGIKISAVSSLKVTIGAADLTAGKVRFTVFYTLSQTSI